MSKHKPQTNVEIVTHLMEYSRNGALIQAFVITALEKYASQVVEAGPENFDSGLLSGEAWVRCAQETLGTIERYYGQPSTETA